MTAPEFESLATVDVEYSFSCGGGPKNSLCGNHIASVLGPACEYNCLIFRHSLLNFDSSGVNFFFVFSFLLSERRSLL